MGWHIVAAVPSKDGGRIEATDTIVLLRLQGRHRHPRETRGQMGARLDIRSKSRVGDTDLARTPRTSAPS